MSTKVLKGRISEVDGYWYPTVTQILSLTSSIPLFGKKSISIDAQARIDRGVSIHQSISEYFMSGELFYPKKYDDFFSPPFLAELPILAKEHLSSEQLIFSQDGYCGRYDFLGKKGLIDFKTSEKPLTSDYLLESFYQLAAYALALKAIDKLPSSLLRVVVVFPGGCMQYSSRLEVATSFWCDRFFAFTEILSNLPELPIFSLRDSKSEATLSQCHPNIRKHLLRFE